MPQKVFFQIGTCNGNDNFRKKVIEQKPDLVILVEPNEAIIPLIQSNYSGIDNVYIYNNAIYYKDNENVDLYVWEDRDPGNTIQQDILKYQGHFSLVPMNNWGSKDGMLKISAESITFDTICINHDITEIEFLQIDTEGFDSEIIKMIDFTKYKIKQLRFEYWNFDKDCFTKYNEEKADELGINGMNAVIQKLQSHNYSLNRIMDEDGNDIIATLIPILHGAR